MRLERILDAISPNTLPYGMFTRELSDREARRAKRLESIYHVGQDRIWDGREILSELIAKHGTNNLDERTKQALGRIFSIIMWGELAAWRISAQLADVLEPLEAKLAASSQVHDEARHFYVMHDYLEAIGAPPKPMDPASRRVVELTLATHDLPKKILGMQITIETMALTIFAQVRALEVDPVLTELLAYYERDEARHVGLGVQLLPQLLGKMSIPERLSLLAFQTNLMLSAMLSLRAMEPDLATLGVRARDVMMLGFRKNLEVHEMIRADNPDTPEKPPIEYFMNVANEMLFPEEGPHSSVPVGERARRAFDAARGARPGLREGSLEARRGGQAKLRVAA
ncbi:MAG: ferritin-like domain-containing protein [Deltaproteobacteria bacterium]|nr:ferritin-like domain-containing protein [Deltaproteobacteria bacterium]